ncbi:MAG: transcription antitermination factor NusB [Terrimicrobiaceae bacterium]|nr:transcription antitermination factor NusB [Terrimicrobiaceae bacterium]
MGVRRDAREAAVQYLYQREIRSDENDSELEDFYRLRGLSPSAKRFCDALLKGWMSRRGPVDEAIRKHTVNYEFGRLSAVDRNVLRIAVYELLFCPDVPGVVAINEAIEIAKKYSSDESGKFVNGILDAIRKSKERA